MKKFIEKFTKLSLPLKGLSLIGIFWLIPFIESFIYGFTSWSDLPVHTLILVCLGLICFAYVAMVTFFIPIFNNFTKPKKK